MRLASEAIQLGRSHRDLTVANHIELHRALDLLRIRSVSFALIASLGCLSRHLSEMMDRIAKGPEAVKKSVRAADELP